MRFQILFLIFLLASCSKDQSALDTIKVTGIAGLEDQYIIIQHDTIKVKNGAFNGTVIRTEDQYNYIKLSSWKWPKIVFVDANKTLDLDLSADWTDSADWTNSEDGLVNEFLLHKDSILIAYSAKWNMTESDFREAWEKDFPENLRRIDNFFEGHSVSSKIIEELKQMEYLYRAHLTINFEMYQNRKSKEIDKDIYDFITEIDFENPRLAFHQSNRNFQQFYYLNKVDRRVSEANYPFAAIDTVNKYVVNLSIRKNIIASVVRKGLRNETVDHERLFSIYEEYIGDIEEKDPITELYRRIQHLTVGQIAPNFGVLSSSQGEQVSQKSLRGKNVLLTVWGSWCPYCKEELPYIKRLQERYPDKFLSLGISLDTDESKWLEYIKANDWKGIHLRDEGEESLFRRNFLISGTNVHFLIDKDGFIRAAGLAPSSSEMEEIIKNLK